MRWTQGFDGWLSKYAFDDDLYHSNIYHIILKYFDEDQARIAMGEVHGGIFGTQSRHKIKWLLRCVAFF